jgi:hypothetical protein
MVPLSLKALRSNECLHPYLAEAVLQFWDLICWIDVHLSSINQNGKSGNNIMYNVKYFSPSSA